MLKKHFSLMAKCIDRNQKSDSSANTLSFFSLVTVLVRVFGLCYGVFFPDGPFYALLGWSWPRCWLAQRAEDLEER